MYPVRRDTNLREHLQEPVRLAPSPVAHVAVDVVETEHHVRAAAHVPENDFVRISVQLHGPVVVARLALSADGVRLQVQRLADTLLELVLGSRPYQNPVTMNMSMHMRDKARRPVLSSGCGRLFTWRSNQSHSDPT